MPRHGDHARAWAPRLANGGEEWIELTYPQPTIAAGIEVSQSFNPGAIIRLDVVEESGVAKTIWTGPDTTAYTLSQIAVLSVAFPPTARPVVQVRVVLDTTRVAGWNEIDAVKLIVGVGAVEPPALRYTLRAGAGVLEFPAWPSGFALQQASRLETPDWHTVAESPPVAVPAGEATAFFRLVGTP